MSKLEEKSSPTHDDLIFPCDCYGNHYLRISWDFIDPEYRFLWIAHQDRPRGRRRITDAWRSLRGLELLGGEVTLSSESIASLYRFLANELGQSVITGAGAVTWTSNVLAYPPRSPQGATET